MQNSISIKINLVDAIKNAIANAYRRGGGVSLLSSNIDGSFIFCVEGVYFGVDKYKAIPVGSNFVLSHLGLFDTEFCDNLAEEYKSPYQYIFNPKNGDLFKK